MKNNEQYQKALDRAYALMQRDIKPDSKESDELETLSILIKEYEKKNHPFPKSNPIEAVKFPLEQKEEKSCFFIKKCHSGRFG